MEEFLKRALKKLWKYSLSEFFFKIRMVSYLFFRWQNSSLLTAREEEILQAQCVWGEMWARNGDSLSPKLMGLSWALR